MTNTKGQLAAFILACSLAIGIPSGALATTALAIATHLHPAPAVTVQAPQKAYLPPCDGDDDMAPCYWDSAAQGDGQGASFIIYKGTIWYSPDGVNDQCVGMPIPNPCDPDSNN